MKITKDNITWTLLSRPPKALVENPDSFWNSEAGDQLFLKVCHLCRMSASFCKCPAPKQTVLLLWEQGRGLNQTAWDILRVANPKLNEEKTEEPASISDEPASISDASVVREARRYLLRAGMSLEETQKFIDAVLK